MLWYRNKFSIFTISLLILITSAVFSPAYGTLLQTFNNPNPSTNDLHGQAVSISGNRALVGAPNTELTGGPGTAYLYDTTNGNLLQTFNNPTPAGGDQFGIAVSLDGNNALIGARNDDTGASDAGSAYLFDATTGNLLQTFNNPTPALNDEFGGSVSVSGIKVLIGASQDDTGASDAGSAYVFATTGALLQTINNPTPGIDEFFGTSVSLDGNNALIGSPSDDFVPNAGRAYLFDATTGNLLQPFNNPTPVFPDAFGVSVSVSGTKALIGAQGESAVADLAGAAYIFDITNGNLLHTLLNPTATSFELFGSSVSLSGNNALVGAPFHDAGNGAGIAHLFDASTGNLVKTFNNPSGSPAADFFGTAVSCDGNNALIGAPQHDTGFSNSGIAYLFDKSTAPPPPPTPTVGGELIPLDTTSLLLAGAQYTAAWMIPVIVSAIGIGIVIARKF